MQIGVVGFVEFILFIRTKGAFPHGFCSLGCSDFISPENNIPYCHISNIVPIVIQCIPAASFPLLKEPSIPESEHLNAIPAFDQGLGHSKVAVRAYRTTEAG